MNSNSEIRKGEEVRLEWEKGRSRSVSAVRHCLTAGMGAMGGGCHPLSSGRGRKGEGPSVEFASHFVLNRRSPVSPSAAVRHSRCPL